MLNRHVCEDRLAQLGGVSLRLVSAGAGEPVIFVHGYMSSVEEQWINHGFFARMAEQFQIHAYDNRGHGQSQKFHSAEDYGPKLAEDLFRVMDHLCLESAHVVGYSMGSMISSRALLIDASRFRTLTLGGASARYWKDPSITTQDEAEAQAMEQADLSLNILRLWPDNLPKPSALEIAELSRTKLAGQDPCALAAVRRSMQQLVTPLEAYKSRDFPILGVIGTADPYLASLRQLKAAVPEVKLVEINGASHEDAPGRLEFFQAVRDFIGSNI